MEYLTRGLDGPHPRQGARTGRSNCMNSPPNVLFLFSDQHCQSVAGCYGDFVAETPNLDRLAAAGVVFDNCYTPSPICTPARMSMLTARYPYRQQVWTNEDMLASDIPAFPHALGAAGYRPVLAGRLHALGPDQFHGYVERHIGDHAPNWPGGPGHDLGILRGTNNPTSESIKMSGAGQSAYELLDEATRDAAIEQLRTFADEQQNGGTEPFSLTVGFMLPHPPYVAREADYRRFEGKVAPPRIPAQDAESCHPFLRYWRDERGVDDFLPEDCTRAKTAYYGLTYRLDCMLGKVLDTLEELGLTDNTLVIYSSDHGDQIGERGMWWKHTFCDQSAKVPLVMSWPGVLPAGERREQVVDLLDVTATILDAAAAPELPNSNGRSFLGVAKDSVAPWRNRVFSEYCMDAGSNFTNGRSIQQRMVRDGPWKLIYYAGYPSQLFDLSEDPDELNDRAADPACRSILQTLTEAVLADWDPEFIARRMESRAAEKNLITRWVRRTVPADVIRWAIKPEQNRLD